MLERPFFQGITDQNSLFTFSIKMAPLVLFVGFGLWGWYGQSLTMQVFHCWDLAAHPRHLHPFNPDKLRIGRDPTATLILTPHNSCDFNTTDARNSAELEFGLTGGSL